jgi:hypothetical protein
LAQNKQAEELWNTEIPFSGLIDDFRAKDCGFMTEP